MWIVTVGLFQNNVKKKMIPQLKNCCLVFDVKILSEL